MPKAYAVFLVFILAFMGSLVYRVHADYRYPLHVDEWHHIAKAVQTTENQGITYTDPYFKTPRSKTTHEEGFHVLLSVLFTLTGLDVVLYYRFLPAASAMFTGLALYAMMRRFTSQATALTSLLLLSTIKSNVNILGFFFYTPFSAAFPLVYLTAYSTINALNHNKTEWLQAAALMALALSVFHPLSTLLMAPVAFVYALTTPDKTGALARKLATEKTTLTIVCAALIVLTATLASTTASPAKLVSTILDRIIFPQEEIPFDVTYSTLKLYGLGASAAAFLGVILVLKDDRLRFFVIWLFTSSAVIFMYHKTDYTLLLPYHRALYYEMLGMAPLSAVGVVWVVKSASKLKAAQIITPLLAILLLTPILHESFKDYYKPPSEVKLYNVIDDHDYDALAWLRSNYDGGHVVLASFWKSLAVYPITKNHVVAAVPAVIGGGEKNDLDLFFSGNCDMKEKITRKHKVEFVLSDKQITCPNLEEAYKNKEEFLYTVK